MAIITLTTDFGLADGYVGIMKGVILGILPDVQLVDMSHQIAPQDVRQAIHILARAVPFFPRNTIHLVIVDPGVGSARRPLLVTTRQAAYVAPDNGVLTRALQEEGARAFELDQPSFWLPEVSRTFHGRDIFAPVAAHLARGVPAAELGHPIDNPLHLELAVPIRHDDGRISGEVIYRDHYGNLITNIPGGWVAAREWQICIAGLRIDRLSSTYAEVPRGGLAALITSGHTIEVAVREGSAADLLHAGPGEPVVLWPATDSSPSDEDRPHVAGEHPNREAKG